MVSCTVLCSSPEGLEVLPKPTSHYIHIPGTTVQACIFSVHTKIARSQAVNSAKDLQCVKKQ